MFGGNMQGMMKKVQKMQKEMKKLQDDLKKRTVEATVGGGVLTIVMNGEKNVESVHIDPSIIDPEDAEMLEDLDQKLIEHFKNNDIRVISWSQPSMKPTRKSRT